MKRLNRTQRLLAAALVLAVGIWAVDSLTRGGGPRQANAQQSAETTVPAPADWGDVAKLVERLTRSEYAPVATGLAQVERDLFLPTPAIERVILEASPPPEEERGAPPAEQAEPEFPDRHQLLGVMLGTTPLAVVDDLVVPRHAMLDGHVLIELHQYHVVFAEPATGKRFTLTLEAQTARPGTPR